MKAKGSPKVHTSKTKYVSDEAFANLKHALQEALAFERGERQSLRVTRIEGFRSPRAPVKIQRSDKR